MYRPSILFTLLSSSAWADPAPVPPATPAAAAVRPASTSTVEQKVVFLSAQHSMYMTGDKNGERADAWQRRSALPQLIATGWRIASITAAGGQGQGYALLERTIPARPAANAKMP